MSDSRCSSADRTGRVCPAERVGLFGMPAQATYELPNPRDGPNAIRAGTPREPFRPLVTRYVLWDWKPGDVVPDYRRNYIPGGTYFFTCVTHKRRPILTTELGRRCLREAIHEVQKDHPFTLFAIVLVPDHWHCVWTLPEGDARYPLHWMRIKEEFTERWLAGGGTEAKQSASREQHRMRGVWQKRYWEHTVRGGLHSLEPAQTRTRLPST